MTRIRKLDKDIKNAHSDSTFLIARATEDWLNDFINQVYLVCKKNNPNSSRPMIAYGDVALAAKRGVPKTSFLNDLTPVVKMDSTSTMVVGGGDTKRRRKS